MAGEFIEPPFGIAEYTAVDPACALGWAAVEACRLPPSVFSLLNGDSNELGAALVAHPLVKAVGFTGSRAGGLSLTRIASKKAEPIPVDAEMSIINPVLLLPGALAARADELGNEGVILGRGGRRDREPGIRA